MSLKKKKEHIERLEDMATKRHSQWGDVWKRLCKNKLAMVGLGVVAFLILVAIFADVIAPCDPYAIDPANALKGSSAEHLLGTDNMGRDILSRLIYGSRTSLLVALISLTLSTIIGAIIGGIAGFFGGWWDTILMRLLDILMAVPQILLAVSISAMLGRGTFNTALAISVSAIPGSARLIRSSILTVRDQEYVEAATATGSSRLRVLFKHVLPNCLAPLIVDTSMRIGGSIMAISGLSFIGLGVKPPIAEWGSIMTDGRTYIREFWQLSTYPGFCIMLALFGFNVFGDGLRDAMDPKLKK